MKHSKEEEKRLSLSIYSNKAESGPPLGTVLGNIGVNAIRFCKDFNEFTAELPDYVLLRVIIDIPESKNYRFEVFEPTTGFIMSILKKEETLMGSGGSTYIEEYIEIEDFLKLVKFKFQDLPFEVSIPIMLGCLKCTNIKIKY
jgi:large subunit ribosomal protein L11